MDLMAFFMRCKTNENNHLNYLSDNQSKNKIKSMNISKRILIVVVIASIAMACKKDETICTSDQVVDQTRGDADQTLPITNSVNISTSGSDRIITSNSIPSHEVGLLTRTSHQLFGW